MPQRIIPWNSCFYDRRGLELWCIAQKHEVNVKKGFKRGISECFWNPQRGLMEENQWIRVYRTRFVFKYLIQILSDASQGGPCKGKGAFCQHEYYRGNKSEVRDFDQEVICTAWFFWSGKNHFKRHWKRMSRIICKTYAYIRGYFPEIDKVWINSTWCYLIYLK